MKKIFLIILAVMVVFLAARPVQAGHGGAFLFGLGLGFLLSPPVIYSAPPAYYAPAYPVYPPARHYYRYYDDGAYAPSRVWVGGYWESRWNPYARCWERTWIPGHWRYY